MKIQNKKIKQRTQFPSMEGRRAAAGWSENTRMCYTLVIASAAKQSSQLCTRVCADISHLLDRHGRNAPPR